MLVSELEKFGLTQKEAKTYLALLMTGEANVNTIASRSDVNRSSLYVVLQSLKKKDLVTEIEEHSIKKYKACPPERLAEIAHTKLEKYRRIHKTVTEMLPNLKNVHNNSHHKTNSELVRVYKGPKGIMEAFEKTLFLKNKKLRAISSTTRLSKLLPPTYLSTYIKRRMKSELTVRAIHPKDSFAKAMLRVVSKENDEVLFIRSKDYEFLGDIAVVDNSVGFMTKEGDGSIVVIKNREIATSMKKLFDLAYERLSESSTDSLGAKEREFQHEK